MDFDEFYTIEFFGPKGWEVFQTHEKRNTYFALKAFEDILLHKGLNAELSAYQWRMTTPKV